MTHNTDPLTLKLSLREKCAYGMGDFGSNLMLCIGTLYLLKFYTDELGMPAFYGGIIFLVAKFFTAFTDMLTGVLLDSRRNIGAKGKFRPFILYASVPVALVATAQFMANDFSLTVKTALATVLFMMFGLCYSLMNCAYGAMVPGLAPIFPYTFYHLTHDWFVAADIPVANDTPVHYADAIRCNVRRPPQGSLPLLTRRVSA